MKHRACENIRTTMQELCDMLSNLYLIEEGVYALNELEQCDEADDDAYHEYVETDIALHTVSWNERVGAKSLYGTEFRLIGQRQVSEPRVEDAVRLIAIISVVLRKHGPILKCTVYDATFADTMLADLLVESMYALSKKLRICFHCASKVTRYRQLR